VEEVQGRSRLPQVELCLCAHVVVVVVVVDGGSADGVSSCAFLRQNDQNYSNVLSFKRSR
jgi:hypothetical protein